MASISLDWGRRGGGGFTPEMTGIADGLKRLIVVMPRESEAKRGRAGGPGLLPTRAAR